MWGQPEAKQEKSSKQRKERKDKTAIFINKLSLNPQHNKWLPLGLKVTQQIGLRATAVFLPWDHLSPVKAHRLDRSDGATMLSWRLFHLPSLRVNSIVLVPPPDINSRGRSSEQPANKTHAAPLAAGWRSNENRCKRPTLLLSCGGA